MKRNQHGYGKNCHLKMQKNPQFLGGPMTMTSPRYGPCGWRLHKITAPDIRFLKFFMTNLLS